MSIFQGIFLSPKQTLLEARKRALHRLLCATTRRLMAVPLRRASTSRANARGTTASHVALDHGIRSTLYDQVVNDMQRMEALYAPVLVHRIDRLYRRGGLASPSPRASLLVVWLRIVPVCP